MGDWDNSMELKDHHTRILIVTSVAVYVMMDIGIQRSLSMVCSRIGSATREPRDAGSGCLVSLEAFDEHFI